MIENYQEDQEFIGRRCIPGITPQLVNNQIADNPLVYKYWKRNTEEVQQRLIDAFMRTPSNTDCPGYIYGFRNLEEYDAKANTYYIKMGRTKRSNPQQRIFQWQRDDNHRYVQIFTIRSEHNMKLQALIHILFAYARTTLVINGKNRIQWFSFNQKVPTAAVVNLMNLIMEKVHEKEATQAEISEWEKYQVHLNQIRTKNNEQLTEVLNQLKYAVSKYRDTGKENFIAMLKSIVEENELEKVKQIIEKIIEENLLEEFKEKLVIDIDSNEETNESVPSKQGLLLTSTLQKLLSIIKVREEYEKKYGTKFNYILGRVKEAIYFGLKGNEAQSQKKIGENPKRWKNKRYQFQFREKVQKPQKNEKEEKQKHIQKDEKVQKLEKIEKAKQVQKREAQQKVEIVIEQNEKVNRKEQKSQIVSNKQSNQPITVSKSKLSQVYDFLKDKQVGNKVINIFNGQFSIDVSKRVSHNIFILAKTIKVYKEWNISFKAIDSLIDKGKKLNLVIMGKEFVNFEKLKIPKNSAHGITSVLLLDNDNSMVGLDDFLKENSDRLKNEFYQGLKQIFKGMIK